MSARDVGKPLNMSLDLNRVIEKVSVVEGLAIPRIIESSGIAAPNDFLSKELADVLRNKALPVI
jgi:hypothetical protein